MHIMQVERRSRYGRTAFLPVNPAAEVLAEIAGTTEIRPKDIVLAAKLGFRVNLVTRASGGEVVEVETLAMPS